MDLTSARVIIYDEGTCPPHQDELLHLLDSFQLIVSYCHHILPENHLKCFPRRTWVNLGMGSLVNDVAR